MASDFDFREQDAEPLRRRPPGTMAGIIFLLACAGLGIAGLVAVAVFMKGPTGSDRSAARSGQTVSVDCYRLWEEFTANELRADGAYKGKTLEMSGTINRIERHDGAYVAIFSWPVPNDIWFDRIHCRIDPGEQRRFAKFNGGEQITVRGVCLGLKGVNNVVELDRCSLVSRR